MTAVQAVPDVDGVFLVHLPGELKDTAVWRYERAVDLADPNAPGTVLSAVVVWWKCERHIGARVTPGLPAHRGLPGRARAAREEGNGRPHDDRP